jgi:hypothetical protein
MKIVGQNFRALESRKLLKDLPIGGFVAFKREPTNPYDENAVKVFVFNKSGTPRNLVHVGYIARDGAKELSADWVGTGYMQGILESKNFVKVTGSISVEDIVKIASTLSSMDANLAEVKAKHEVCDGSL